MSALIDTTEMYLKSVYELREEGKVALRARIAERLGQSGPTVSETVARLERAELLRLTPARHIEFTPAGHDAATTVMRRHRLAERVLCDMLGLDLVQVHDEACRWEHVLTDVVTDRMTATLQNATTSPFGLPIPAAAGPLVPLPGRPAVEAVDAGPVTVVAITELAQADSELLALLVESGFVPGHLVEVSRRGDEIAICEVPAGGQRGPHVLMDPDFAAHLRVT